MDSKAHKQIIKILIYKIETGFFIDSRDLPQLNLFVNEEANLIKVIPDAIKYLFKHNEGVDVRVLMEVPVFSDDSSTPERIIQLEQLPNAA